MMIRLLPLALALTPALAFAQPPEKQKLAPVESPPSVSTARVDLGAEFPEMKGFTLSQSLTTVPAGTGRAWHSHAGQPEIVRIISGTLTEAHNGKPTSTYGPGSTLINAGGTEHMWANLGSEPVVFIATSIRRARD